MLKVYPIYQNNHLRNYTYLLAETIHKQCVIVDPYDPELTQRTIEQLKLTPLAIINTHDHHDHVQGNEALKKHYAIKNYVFSTIHSQYFENTLNIHNHQILQFKDAIRLECLHTPGHTRNSICLKGCSENGDFLLTGDTLFNAGVGHCKQGGNPEILFETIKHLKKQIPANTVIYPGHDYFERNLKFTLHIEQGNAKAKAQLESLKVKSPQFVTLGQEVAWNLFLREDTVISPHVKELSETNGLWLKERFLKLREMRNEWQEEPI